MKDEKNKVKEPFPADHTPTPPDHTLNSTQGMDPKKQGGNEPRNSKPDSEAVKKDKKKETSTQGTGKLLGDETEITDETTI